MATEPYDGRGYVACPTEFRTEQQFTVSSTAAASTSPPATRKPCSLAFLEGNFGFIRFVNIMSGFWKEKKIREKFMVILINNNINSDYRGVDYIIIIIIKDQR